MLSLRAKFSKPADVPTSQLLPKLFDGFDDTTDGVAVLDVGAGTPGTLDFFAQFRCRVYFLDLFDLDPFGVGCDPETLTDEAEREASVRESFAHALNDYQDELFDICLFWDLLHRMDAPARRGFSHALRPYLYSNSRGYGICQLYPGKKSVSYRMRNATELEVAPGPAALPGSWSQSELAEQFDCFSIVQDTLSPQGRLEYLMQAD